MGKLVNNLLKSIKLAGFKRSGNNFLAYNGIFHSIINFQSSAFNDIEEDFTINVGVFSEPIHELVWQSQVSKAPKEVNSIFRARISFFSGSQQDQWWHLSGLEDVTAISSHIMELFVDKVIPFTDKITSYEALLDATLVLPKSYLSFPLIKIQIACLQYIIGNVDAASGLLHGLSEVEGWGERAQRVLLMLQQGWSPLDD